MNIRKSNYLTILLLISSLSISVLIAEFSFKHFYDQGPVYNYKALRGNFDKYIYTPVNNSLGFREEELPNDIFNRNYKRILFLGDSFTHGHGVNNGSDRFSDIVEDRLNKDPEVTSGRYKYHIYNAGVAATEPRDWYFYLKKLLPVYKPEYVFAIFFLRDGTNVCTSLLCHKEKIRSITEKYESAIWYKYSYVGKYLGNKLIEREFSDYYKNLIINSYLGNASEKKSWVNQQAYIKKIQHLCKTNNIDFHFIVFPMLYGLESDYQYYGVEKEIIRFANKRNMQVFSLTSGFIGHDSMSLWVSHSDQHPNEKGHLVAADTLYPYVKNLFIH